MESIGAFLPLILIFGVFYILLIRPQQKKVREHRDMLNNLRRGDKIITSGGIIASINKVLENKELIIEIAENIEVKIAPGMVANLYITTDTNNKTEKKNNNPSSSMEKKKSGFLSNLINPKK